MSTSSPPTTFRTQTKRQRTWDEVYKSVKSFYDFFGHLQCEDGGDKAWLVSQRINRRNLSAMQIHKLDKIGFDWESGRTKKDNHWDQMFNLLKKFKLQFGNCRVKRGNVYQGKPLGRWVHNQRESFRRSILRQDRHRRLQDV